MEVSEQTQSSPSQNPSPLDNEIKPSNLQSTEGIAPVDQLNKNPNPEAELDQEEKSVSEEPITADEEIHPLNLSSDGRDSIDSNKRKIPEEEKGPLHPLWKTSLCSFFRRQSGSCDHGENCRYAHGEAELRPRPDNSWDPTSERAKKLLKSDAGEKIETIPEEAREDVIPFMPDGADPTDAGLSKCLVHLPRKWNIENLKNFLETNGILYKTAKKKKGMTVGFVGFETEEQMNSATEELEGKSMGNKHLRVANVIPRSYEKRSKMATVSDKRSPQPTEHHSGSEDPTMSPSGAVEDEVTMEKDSSVVDGVATKARSVRDVVTPLAHMPYSNQLEHKKNSLAQTLKRLTRNARKACPDGVPLPEWIIKSRDIGGLPCKLEGILESPQVDGYRNKCEFSVGYSLQGKRTVGFMLGNFREGMTAVEEAVSCPNVSSISCKYALIFQEFLQSSTLPVWNRLDNTGFWRQFTVREGRSLSHGGEIENFGAKIAEVMLIVQVCLSGVDSELVTAEFQRMAEALARGASTCSPPLPLTALIVQDHKGISNAAPSDCPLLPLPIPKVENFLKKDGPNAVETRIHDYISNLRFSISPTAFFQVNTLAAEKLYSLAGDWAGLEPDTLLFDICCGTGTIGLTLAHRVGMVVGVEMNASAISDAQRNAEINGIKNCRYICAKAEDVMSSLLKEYLSMPQQQDETLPDSEGDNKEDVGDRENATHNDKVLRPDSCASNINASAKDENVERMSDCLACGSNGSLEVTHVLKEEVGPTDTMKESNVNASMPDESSRHQMADDKRTTAIQQSSLGEFKDLSQKHCISEENETSAMTLQQFKDVVAIVDPPRVGLHSTVIKALRTHPRLRRLVYISCNPESLVANAIELCTPSPDKPNKGKNNRGWRNMSSAGLARRRAKSMPNSEPFRPVKAMAVDLFPHTPHCEMVMLLER